MDNQPLNVKIDSGSAQADLHALARALDETGAAANRMAAGLSQGMSGADRAIKGSMANMERFAQVAAVVNKIKINSDGTKAVAEFARVMNAVARTQEIEKSKIDSWSKFIQIGAHTSRLKMDSGATAAMNSFIGVMDRAAKTRDINAGKMASWVKFIEIGARAGQLRAGGAGMVGLNAFAQAMDGAAKSRAISQAKLKSWVDFIEVAARSQRLKFDPQTARSLMEFGRAMEGFKAPGKGSIDRLDKMFKVLSSAKPIPNAREVARDLDMIAASATRAAAALAQMPGGRFNVGGAGRRVAAGGAGGGGGNTGADMHAAAGGAGKATGAFNTYAGGADKASKSTYTLGERLRGLNHRFDLAYQASTLFTHAFGAFTIGGLIKGVYDASIELQKLEKAMLFSTKSAEGSKRATQEFIGTVFDMGLALDQVAEPFGRFTISAGAAGMSASDSASIFRSVTQTLQVVGASAAQTGYAMYGLTQMIQKGKVSSEEFSRQIGEQIPGNAEAGRRALERMKGQAVSTAQFFKEMSLGKIMSPEFTKLWAEELNTMFGGLMGLVKDRPDVALNRLKTAFTVFQQEIGKSGFIAELGIQFSRLAEMFGTTENGIFKLKPKFQELAKQLGQNLASMVRMAADAAAWLAENFDKVMFAGKALATLFVARTFLSWGQTAMTAMGSIVQLTKALTGLSIAQKAVAGTEVASSMVPAGRGSSKPNAATLAAQAALGGGGMADIQQWRNQRGFAPGAGRVNQMNMGPAVPPMSGFGRRARFANMNRPLGATADVLAMRSAGVVTQTARPSVLSTIGSGAATAARAAPMAALGALKTGAMALGATFGILGVAAVATGAALTILSDKSTKVGDATVKFADIMTGWMKNIGDKMGSWFNDLFGRMTGSDGPQGALDALGNAFLATTVTLSYFGELLGDTAGAVVHLLVAIGKAASSDFKGAWDEVKQIGEDWKDNGPGSMDRRMAEGLTATLNAAADRMSKDRANEAAEARLREAERQLQAQKAADDQLKAANLQLEAANKLKDNFKIPTVDSVMARVNALANGSYDRANPALTAEQRTAKNIETARAAQAATAPVTPTTATPAASGIVLSHRTASGQVLTASTREELSAKIFNELQTRSPDALAPAFGNVARPGTKEAAGETALGGTARLIGALSPLLRPLVKAGLDQYGRATERVPVSAEERARHNAEFARYTAARIASATETRMQQRQAFGGVTVPDRYRDQLNASASRHGVDPAVMARLVRVESSFNQNAVGPEGMAVGLGQFIEETWNRMQPNNKVTAANRLTANDPRKNPTLALDATAKYMAENNAKLATVLGRNANTGEQYLAHFLGGEGAQKLLRARAADPSTTVGSIGIGGTKAYRANPNTFTRGAQTSVQDVYNWAQNFVNQRGTSSLDTSNVVGGAAEAETEIEKLQEKHLNTWKSLQTILAMPDPASQSNASFDAMLEKLNDIAAADEDLRRQAGPTAAMIDSPIRDQIKAAIDRASKDLADAMNPVAKANRIARETNELTLMTLRGMGKEAEWQAKINDLKEQGYPIELMQDETKWAEHVARLRATGKDIMVESLEVSRRQWEIERDRTKALEAQVRLLDTINEAQMRLGKAGGTQSSRDTYLNDLINQSVQGGTFAQKKAEVESNPDLMRALSRTADVQALSDRAEAARGIVVEMSDQMDMVTATGVDRRIRATYRDTLRELTGMTNSTLSEIEASLAATTDGSGKALTDLAMSVAQAREKLENPPGFQAWVDGLEPFAQRMESIKGAFMDGLSDGITDELMGEDVDWKSIFKNIRRQITKAQVDNALGGLLGFMGVKKGPGEEAQTALTAATAQYEAAKSLIDQITTAAANDAAAEVAAIQAAKDQQTEAAKQVAALVKAADALSAIAEKMSPGYARTAMNDVVSGIETQAARVATGAVMPTASAPARAAQPSALVRTQGILDRTFERLGLPSPNILTPASTPATATTPLPTASAVQAVTAPAPSNLGEDVNTTSLARRAMGFFFKTDSNTAETATRMTTQGAMATAPAAGPIAAMASEGSSDDAGMALFTAANALMAVPPMFAAPVGSFKTTIEKFDESLKNLDKIIAKLTGGDKGTQYQPLSNVGMEEGVGVGSDGNATLDLSVFTKKLATGGYVSGPGGPRADSINARLSNGEFVINAAATAQNRGLLEAINAGKAYASGGLVDGLPGYAGGGFFAGLGSMFGKGFGNMKSKFTKPTLSNVFGRGANGKADSPLSWVGETFGKGRSMEERGTGALQGLTQLVNLIEMIKGPEAPEKEYKPVNGVIGESRAVTVDATEVAAHSNMIADLIDIGANMATGGAWGKAATYRQMLTGSISALGNAFADGGYVTNSGMDWGKAPHYDVGTANTSNGGMPAIVHPNEAIIPLPNGRSVPVDMGGLPMGGGSTVSTNITIVAPNPDAFRKSSGSIQRQQNRDQRRAAARNLN